MARGRLVRYENDTVDGFRVELNLPVPPQLTFPFVEETDTCCSLPPAAAAASVTLLF